MFDTNAFSFDSALESNNTANTMIASTNNTNNSYQQYYDNTNISSGNLAINTANAMIGGGNNNNTNGANISSSSSTSDQQENSFYKFSYEKVDVILTYEDKQDRDYVQQVPVQLAAGGGIRVNEVLNYLSGEAFPIYNSRIFYYSYSNDFFIYCGMENAIADDHMIPLKDQMNNNGTKTITLKVRRPEISNGSPETERTAFFEHDNTSVVDFQGQSSYSSSGSVNMMNENVNGYD